MNIDLHTRKKVNDILKGSGEEAVNENFDRLAKDVMDMSTALTEYEVDLTADVTGELPVANIDIDAVEAALGLTDPPFTARVDQRRWAQRHATITSVLEVGIGASTDSNSAGAAPDTVSAFTTYTTPAVAGNKAGFDMATFCRSSYSPLFSTYLRTGATVTDIRMWIGLSSAGHTNVDTHAAHTIAFRYSTNVPDAGWVGITRDGTTQSATASIHPFAASTLYRLSFEVVGGTSGTVTFTVEDITNGTSATATLSANLPLNTQNLLGSVQLFTIGANARSWQWSRTYLESD